MCGFIGSFSKLNIDPDLVDEANHYLICRGPDQKTNFQGTTREQLNMNLDLNFSFIFNRLSIIDLSDLANQPMLSNHFGNLIMFNGEVFNHDSLRKSLELKNITFTTDHSDTEVVLNGLSDQGLSFLDKIVGQFSIFFLDSRNHKAYLIRDRLGQKPLFYYKDNETFAFSSNLKSLNKLIQKDAISEKAIFEYLNLGVVTSPNTIFENYFKVEPGQVITFDLSNSFQKSENFYWSLNDSYGNDKFNQNKFKELLIDSVRLRNVSDVPVANFLSGGIDSTLIVKLQSLIEGKTNTFTVGYDDKKYDESNWANIVSKKYSTNHFLKNIHENELNNLVLDSLDAFDEPYADPSVVPSFTISKLISEKYKVAISGDGGDELSFGYVRTDQVMNSLNLNKNIANLIFSLYPGYLGTGANIAKNSSNKSFAYASFFEDVKLLNILGIENSLNFSSKFISKDFTDYKNLMHTEYSFYLSEQMMMKVDRTSMANSLEVRSPFVDHRLIEYIFSTDEKDYTGKGRKQILKNLLSDDFNDEFLGRKKMGFVFNVENYIRNNLNIFQETIFEGIDLFKDKKDKINNLYKYKSRINSLRYWKMFVLQSYLNSVK